MQAAIPHVEDFTSLKITQRLLRLGSRDGIVSRRSPHAIKHGAHRAGCSFMSIVSGAGHDSANIAKIAPTAMIFVACKDDLSHNPAESATREDCAAGAQALLNAVLFYDQQRTHRQAAGG